MLNALPKYVTASVRTFPYRYRSHGSFIKRLIKIHCAAFEAKQVYDHYMAFVYIVTYRTLFSRGRFTRAQGVLINHLIKCPWSVHSNAVSNHVFYIRWLLISLSAHME